LAKTRTRHDHSYRPQTDGKVERERRSLDHEWVCQQARASNQHRVDALPVFQDRHNYL
jgi:hypothetical protein